jgi:hypothetical protein
MQQSDLDPWLRVLHGVVSRRPYSEQDDAVTPNVLAPSNYDWLYLQVVQIQRHLLNKGIPKQRLFPL